MNTLLTRCDVSNLLCPRGDLNPHALSRALAPQASASTYSATRTCGCTPRGARTNYSNLRRHAEGFHRGRVDAHGHRRR